MRAHNGVYLCGSTRSTPKRITIYRFSKSIFSICAIIFNVCVYHFKALSLSLPLNRRYFSKQINTEVCQLEFFFFLLAKLGKHHNTINEINDKTFYIPFCILLSDTNALLLTNNDILKVLQV